MKRRDFLINVGGATIVGTGAMSGLLCAGKQETHKKYRVIDSHLHIFDTTHKVPTHFDDNFNGLSRKCATAEKTIEGMKRGGIEKAFLITYSAHDIARDISDRVDPDISAPVYAREYAIKTWQDNRHMFYWFPDHVDPSRPGYLEDLRKDFELGADGVKILSNFHGFLPDNPGFMPVYEMCHKYNKPVIIDGSFWYFKKFLPNKESKSRQKEAQTIKGYTKTLATVLAEFPTVAFSLAHTGTAAVISDYDEIYKVMSDHSNVTCDTAASRGYGAEWFQDLVQSVGAHKVMYGTDWPYWLDEGLDSYRKGRRRWTMITDDCPKLTEHEKKLILAENADRFIKNRVALDDNEEIKKEVVK